MVADTRNGDQFTQVRPSLLAELDKVGAVTLEVIAPALVLSCSVEKSHRVGLRCQFSRSGRESEPGGFAAWLGSGALLIRRVFKELRARRQRAS